MNISGSNEGKEKPGDGEANKVSPQVAKEVGAIEIELFQLMTSSSQKPKTNCANFLKERVARVANTLESQKGTPGEHSLSSRLKLVVTAADQWIRAKRAEASNLLKEQ